MIETKKQTEVLLLFTSLIIIPGAILTQLPGTTELQSLVFFSLTIIVISCLEFINSVSNNRMPKSNFLISGEFLAGSAILISALASGSEISGIIGASAIFYACLILLESDLWPGLAARFVNYLSAIAILTTGIMYLSASIPLNELILWVLGGRALSNLILSFMEVRY